MASASVQLYRDLIPAHSAVPNSVVERFLEMVSLWNAPAAWGVVFTEAMVYLAAHMIERTPGYGSFLATEVGGIVMQADGALSRQYAPAMASSMDQVQNELATTIYGQNVLMLRSMAPNIAPTVVLALAPATGS